MSHFKNMNQTNQTGSVPHLYIGRKKNKQNKGYFATSLKKTRWNCCISIRLYHLNLPQTFFGKKSPGRYHGDVLSQQVTTPYPLPAPHQWRFPVVSVGTLSPWLIQTGTFSELMPFRQVGCWMFFFWILVDHPWGVRSNVGIFLWGDNPIRFGVGIHLLKKPMLRLSLSNVFEPKKVGNYYRRKLYHLMSVCRLRDVYERNIWLVRECMANI